MTAEAPRRVGVTPRQVRAAKIALTASAKLGREPDPELVRIANAKPREQERSA